ncbi:MAG: YegS/Rv2252/BmrU family lipid kinase [Lachnoclostridium sp.]|nr:YegS/Rv2252/BmrU family lipid kinase [Lachnospira sp.]MCM1248228.1 YegS/Rv2252/BmrU family lipid kinase [Lachnoclostridium sp.]MCM1534984.1 YegS/Rv2252/BmrU family lipid kinase [Clostridium sp.]
MERTMLFIYNPRAGKEKIKGKLAQILDIFAKAGYEMTVYPTLQSGDAKRIVADCKKQYDLVVCSGGDGTLDEVVTGMMQSAFKAPIGYIPAGSTNDFGGSLSLPKNMVRAAEIAVGGSNFACDVGTFNNDVFVYIAAFGIFTEVSYGTEQEIKNMIGHMAYLLEGMRSIPNIRSYHMKISYEDQVIEDDFIFGMITNSASVGGFKRITGKHVKLDDGVFEVTLIKSPKNPMELNNIIVSLLNRDIDSDAMYCFKTSALTLESPEEEVAWTLDGEFGGSHEKVVIENQCKAIEFRVGKTV